MYMWRELESCLYPALTRTLTVLPAGGRVRLLTDWQSCRQQHRAWLKDRGGRLDNQEEKIRHFLNNENQYVLGCVCWGWCFICLTGSVRRIERTGKWWYYIIDGWKDRWLSSLCNCSCWETRDRGWGNSGPFTFWTYMVIIERTLR